MRDPKRIERICELLKKKWEKHPDLRLGQLLINYVFGGHPIHPKYDAYIFYQEDDITEKRLERE